MDPSAQSACESYPTPRPIAVIRKQLSDLKGVKQEASEYGTPDFASKMGMRSILNHESELLDELRAAQLLASSADAEFTLDGEPIRGNEIPAAFLGDFLRTVQDVIFALAQLTSGQPTPHAKVRHSIIAETGLLVSPGFIQGSFGVRVRFPTREELGLTYEPMAREVLESVCELLSDENPSRESMAVLSHSRVKSHYSKLIELLAKQDVRLCVRTRTRPFGVRVTPQQARDRSEWLRLLQTREEVIEQTGYLVGGSTE